MTTKPLGQVLYEAEYERELAELAAHGMSAPYAVLTREEKEECERIAQAVAAVVGSGVRDGDCDSDSGDMRASMKKWDERARVKAAISNWIANYGLEGSYKADSRCRRVGMELQALDVETATGAQVSEIIGNSSWAEPMTCNQCGDATYEIVEVGEPQGYESATAYICKGCLRKALALFD